MPGMNGEFVPKPPLAESNYHHEAMGSSHRSLPDMPENLHRPHHEFMSDNELRAYVEKEIATVREEHSKLGSPEAEKGGMSHGKMFLMIRDKFLMPNLHYLAVIGRLPDGIDIAALEAELVMPDENN